MATVIFVDKENGELGTRATPKDRPKLGSRPSVKALDGRSQVSAPHVGKMFDAPPALRKAPRKALGTVNRATEKSVKTNAPVKEKQTAFPAKTVTEKAVKAKGSAPASDDTYPEIEKFFPFNPLADQKNLKYEEAVKLMITDFESFDLPEEHQIAQLPLSGVPLMILDEERKLEKLLHLGPPSPLKAPSLPWESDPFQSPSSLLSTLDVELPPVCYDLEI